MDIKNMSGELLNNVKSNFDSIRHMDVQNREYWSARELSSLLGYVQWRNFELNIKKAIQSIKNIGEDIDKNFVKVTKMIETGNNTVREIDDVRLSRYACYIIAMNGDPSKKEIAAAQTYFAHQTRKQELNETYIKDKRRIEARQKLSESDRVFSGVAMSRGVNGLQLANIKSQGDKRLFGGNDTRAMKQKYKISDKKPLADHLPTVSLTAKQLANEMTTINAETKNLQGFGLIGTEHLKNNAEVRNSLTQRGIYLENLPPEEDVKKVERRIKSADKKMLDNR